MHDYDHVCMPLRIGLAACTTRSCVPACMTVTPQGQPGRCACMRTCPLSGLACEAQPRALPYWAYDDRSCTACPGRGAAVVAGSPPAPRSSARSHCKAAGTARACVCEWPAPAEGPVACAKRALELNPLNPVHPVLLHPPPYPPTHATPPALHSRGARPRPPENPRQRQHSRRTLTGGSRTP